MNLVEIKKTDLVTYSDLIALGVKRTHDTVIKLIDRNIDDLKEFGEVGFEIRAGYNGSKTRIAALNEQQATLLITYMRNNDVVRKFKKSLVKAFFLMRSELGEKIECRKSLKLEYRPMTDAIKFDREIQGKGVSPYHFSNEADLINRIVLGMTSAKFKVFHNIGKDESIRDYLTPCQLKSIADLQRANTAYLQEGLSFEDRKKKLTTLFERVHLLALTNKIHGISA